LSYRTELPNPIRQALQKVVVDGLSPRWDLTRALMMRHDMGLNPTFDSIPHTAKTLTIK